MACCDICGAVFTFQNNLYRHIVFSHNENDQAPSVKYDQCDYEGTYNNLLAHKNNKHRVESIKCSLCEETFHSKANLNRHTQSKHKDLSPFECPICYKGFTRKDILKRHMKVIHFTKTTTSSKSSEEKFPCDFCKKHFCNSQNLKRHHKNVHFIVSDTRFQNNENKSSKNNVNDVINDKSDSSSKEVNYFCEPCDTKFINKFNYIRHMKLPEHGPKNSKCPQFNKSFNTKSHLNRHVKH